MSARFEFALLFALMPAALVVGLLSSLVWSSYALGWALGAAIVGLVLVGTERGALAAGRGPGLYVARWAPRARRSGSS